MTMKNEDQDLLSQYIDGELDSQDTLLIKQRLLAEPELNEHYQKLKQLNGAIENAFSDIAEDPIPDGLADLLSISDDVDNVAESKQTTAENNVHPIGLSDETSILEKKKSNLWYLPLAASILFAVVLGNYLIGNNPANTPEHGAWAMAQNALETTESMESLTFDANVQFVAVQSFEHRDGRLCREYYMRTGDNNERGIACRDTGTWIKEAFSIEDMSQQSDIVTASEEATDIDQFLSDINAGEIEPSKERNLLKSGWKK